MIIALWIVNGLLAVAFVGAGSPKLVFGKDRVVASGQKGLADIRPSAVRLIGLVEVLAAIGLILPLLLGVAPILAPLSAIGLVVVMIGAVVLHTRRRESAVPGVVLAVLAGVSAVLGFLVVLG